MFARVFIGMDDNPMSAGSVATPSPLYNGGGSVQAPRSLSSSSNSTSPPVGTPASSSHMLIIPHPINATKITDAHHVVTQNTSGRKYQCKMCPSVSTLQCSYFLKVLILIFNHLVFMSGTPPIQWYTRLHLQS